MSLIHTYTAIAARIMADIFAAFIAFYQIHYADIRHARYIIDFASAAAFSHAMLMRGCASLFNAAAIFRQAAMLLPLAFTRAKARWR